MPTPLAFARACSAADQPPTNLDQSWVCPNQPQLREPSTWFTIAATAVTIYDDLA